MTPLISSNTLRRPSEPCRLEGHNKERPTRPNDHQQPDVSQINSQPRNAGSVHSSRVLHWRGRKNHRVRVLRRDDIYPWDKWCWHPIFAEGKKIEQNIDLWHKWCNHVNFPKLQEMQSKKISVCLAEVQWLKGPVMWSLSTWKASPASIPQRAQSEPK